MITSTQHYSRDLQRYYRMPATQVSLTLVLSVFIIAIFVVFALGPTTVAITTLQKNIADSEQTLAQLETKKASLQAVSAQFELLKPSLPALNTSIPNTGAAYTPLTTTIESIAQQTGVELQNATIGSTLLYSRVLSPFTPALVQQVTTLPVTIRVLGSYTSVSLFLSQLLSVDRLLSVDTITLAKEVDSKTSEAMVVLTMSGNAYYLADQAQLTKALSTSKGAQ